MEPWCIGYVLWTVDLWCGLCTCILDSRPYVCFVVVYFRQWTRGVFYVNVLWAVLQWTCGLCFGFGVLTTLAHVRFQLKLWWYNKRHVCITKIYSQRISFGEMSYTGQHGKTRTRDLEMCTLPDLQNTFIERFRNCINLCTYYYVSPVYRCHF